MPHPFTSLDLVVFGVAIAIQARSAILGSRMGRKPRGERNVVRLYWLTAASAVLISALVLFAWYSSGRPFSALGLDLPVGIAGRIGFGLDAMLVCYFGYKLFLEKRSAERNAATRRRLDELHIVPQTRAEFLLWPIMVLAASPFEELLFRGFLMWFSAGFAGLSGAVLLSSLLFGLGHAYQGWRGTLRTALVGLSFGIAYALTQSLWWLMVAHIVLNLFTGLLASKLMRLSPGDSGTANATPN
ncbi:MAG: CPBP family intramembrane glutamic endopeptidase [Rhizomicrobium sp.]|jgi:membrane protease YdiL (CAAX protease family)